MYFDAVLDPDLKPIFNGTTEETLAWLKEHEEYQQKNDHRVCIGSTMQLVTPWEYVNVYN